MIDFTSCIVDKSANYGGSDKKRGIFYNGERYMLKLSDRIAEDKRNDLNSSYTNSAYSEYLGCHIIKSIGLSVQNTLLGTITLISSNGITREYPVVACENFVPDGYSLVELRILRMHYWITKHQRSPRYRMCMMSLRMLILIFQVSLPKAL